jgi:hypothetical protein
MSACLVIGAGVLMLTGAEFTLDWTHSVEKTAWRETWAIEGGSLRLTKAAVKGSGAGMDPGPGARLIGGWWVWTPDLAPQVQIVLAASGATGAGWRLCDGPDCRTIGDEAGTPITLSACPTASGQGDSGPVPGG